MKIRLLFSFLLLIACEEIDPCPVIIPEVTKDSLVSDIAKYNPEKSGKGESQSFRDNKIKHND
jgi:hypothetical protein